MNQVYLILQLGLSLYCLDIMVQAKMDYAFAIFTIGIHLVFYLVAAISENKKRKRRIYRLDSGWLMLCSLLGIRGLGMLTLLLIVEYMLIEENKVHVMGVGALWIGVSLLNLNEIRMFWGMYGLIVVVGLFIYRNEKKMQYLTEYNQTLREESLTLYHKIEEIGKAKSQIEYITRVSERNMLAQKLHDKIGHTLAGNIMQLEVVKLIFKQDPHKAEEMLTQITNQLRSGMDDIRLTLRELKPEQSELGIQHIKDLLNDLEYKHQVKVYLTYEGDLEMIGVERWQIIIQNLKEVITNFLKHSSGNQLSVSIQHFNQVIRVSFEDNGKVKPDIKKGLGLKGIEERMAMNNGRVVLNTEKGFQLITIFNK